MSYKDHVVVANVFIFIVGVVVLAEVLGFFPISSLVVVVVVFAAVTVVVDVSDNDLIGSILLFLALSSKCLLVNLKIYTIDYWLQRYLLKQNDVFQAFPMRMFMKYFWDE